MHQLGSDHFDNATFEKFVRYIYRKTGIVIGENKKTHLSNRLRARVRQLHLETFSDYWDHLQRNQNDAREIQYLFDAVTTNETYFQRGMSHFHVLWNHVLPEIHKRKPSHTSIWSAACSTGEEAYDLGILALEFEKLYPDMDIHITGTDISARALEAARTGEYGDRRIDKLPEKFIREYFDPVSPGESTLPYAKKVLKVRDTLRRKVLFQFLNLVSDSYLSNVDIIFCRNVMIYFDRKTQLDIIDKMTYSLNKSGYLFIGQSESLQLVPNQLRLIRTSDGNVYQKDS